MIEANPELLMNNALRGHIVLQHVNQTELQFSDIQGGSILDRKTCIFYLSLRNLVSSPDRYIVRSYMITSSRHSSLRISF